MEKEFAAPEMEVVRFNEEDVIATSTTVVPCKDGPSYSFGWCSTDAAPFTDPG